MGLPPEWHGGIYPPGTPAPRTEEVGNVECGNCGEQTNLAFHHELGSVTPVPEECPNCGEPWPEDVAEDAEPMERDWDIEREQQREYEQSVDEDDAREEASEHYPPDFPAEQ